MSDNLPRFARVTDDLYRGGQPTKDGFAQLKKMGVRSVVSLRMFQIKQQLPSTPGMRHFHISFKHLHPEDEDVVEFLGIVTNPANQPVFVHCQGGTDRTGMMIAAYRMVIQGWTREQALAEMRENGFNEIWQPLEEYIENLNVNKLKSKLVT